MKEIKLYFISSIVYSISSISYSPRVDTFGYIREDHAETSGGFGEHMPLGHV